MLLFSKRKRLAELFEVWRMKNGVANSPLGVITFLNIHGLIDKERAARFVEAADKKERASDGL